MNSTNILELHTLVVLGFSLRILLRDGILPSTRMAWLMVILSLPFAGGVLYFLFGEVDIGSRAKAQQAEIFTRIRSRARAGLGRMADTVALVRPQMQPAARYAASINGFQVVPGNKARLLADEKQARARIIEDIDAATDHVHVLYYIWLEDDTGTETARALMRAARRGVTCRAMVDGLGSRVLVKSELWKQMGEAGVELAVALPFYNLIRTIMLSRVDLRNHRKITVIDGTITYCGSQNCADPEFRIKKKYGPWVDILIRVEGPVAAQNQMLFASDWMKEVDTPVERFAINTKARPGGIPVQAVGDGPTERPGASAHLFVSLIDAARETLTITTPYFVPDPTVIEALCAAAYRQVNVILILPKKNDSWVVAAVSRSFYRKLLEAGVNIHEFHEGLLHAKTLTVDGHTLFLGSSNMDERSFDLNYENDMLFHDKEITGAVCARQKYYLANSDPVVLEDVLEWSYPRRIWQNIMATLGPVL